METQLSTKNREEYRHFLPNVMTWGDRATSKQNEQRPGGSRDKLDSAQHPHNVIAAGRAFWEQ